MQSTIAEAPSQVVSGPRPTHVGSSSTSPQSDFSSWVAATADPAELRLGIEGFAYADLFEPARLAELGRRFDAWFRSEDAAAFARFDAYRACKGEGMAPEAISAALVTASPYVSRFVVRLFGVEREAAAAAAETRGNGPLWLFKKDFAKKRLFKPGVGAAWKCSVGEAGLAARRALVAMGAPAALLGSGGADEELAVARATLRLLEVDDVARKAAKAGGARWTEELHERADTVRAALAGDPALAASAGAAVSVAERVATDAEDGRVASFALDAIEAWLAARRADPRDRARSWPSLDAPGAIDPHELVQIRRPNEALPELFVGPEHERRHRDGFTLTDRRKGAREVESELDYCLYCHERDKDSCSKGLVDAKTGATKENALGVPLGGCPLEEKISEMHLMRRDGDSIAALALVCVDNPMLPGTGHRICNDCMKACVYQKQDPVDIPQVETAVLTDVLSLPWGFEIYGLLTRWNPLDVRRPHARAYNGKNVLVVGLGPAGYTLAHHLTAEGFACVAVDGLKLEPLPVELTGDEKRPPRPIRDFQRLYVELDERVLLGFGGVSEYGITVRWDKNFRLVTKICG